MHDPISPPQRFVVITDADNTLWDTDSVYAKTQLRLLSKIEKATGNKVVVSNRLEYIRKIDQEIAKLHGFNLKYPPRILVRAIECALLGELPKEAAVKAISYFEEAESTGVYEKLEKWFLCELNVATPRLRKGVKEGLLKLKSMGAKLIIFTEGSEKKCISNLESHGLRGVFSEIFQERKNIENYKKLFTKYKCNKNNCLMVGDQIDRDIIVAKEAGFYTALFPGGFNPRWNSGNNKNKPDFTIDSFCQIPVRLSNSPFCKLKR